MIHFTPFRTPRLTVQLRELTIGQSIALCARPAHLHEAATTAMLEYVIVPPDRAVMGQVSDPRLMTVQERGALAAHYLAHTLGKANFSIGDTATYSQYLFHEVQTCQEIDVGIVGDDHWFVSPLLGYQAEAIERLIATGRLLKGRQGWVLGAMACQLRREQEDPLQDIPDAQFDEWLVRRLAVLNDYPDSEFARLLGAFYSGATQQHHLLRMAFSSDGIVFVSEVPGLPSARFPVSDLLSDATAIFLGIAAEPAV